MDVFGEAIEDHYEGKKAVVKITRDGGYTDPHNVDTYFRSYRDFDLWEKRALRYVRGRILDVGVGPGRVALYLQRKGFRVTGIDCSKTVVEVAEKRGVKDCRLMDARRLSFRPGSFDTILMFGNNFGIAGSKKRTKKMLRNLHRITSRKGRIIVASIVPGAHLEEHRPYLQRNLERGRDIGLVTLVFEYKGEEGRPFDLLLVSPVEMMQLCHETGWKIVDVIMGDSKTDHYIAIAEKAR